MSNPQQSAKSIPSPQLSKEEQTATTAGSAIEVDYAHYVIDKNGRQFGDVLTALSRVEGERDELRECLLRVQKAYNEAPSDWLPTKELNLAMVAIHVALYGNTEEKPANQVKG